MHDRFNIESGGTPASDEELAAIAAAIGALQSEAAAPPAAAPPRNAWEDSGKLVRQGLAPLKLGTPPTWRTIERVRRHASAGFYGVTGL